MDSDDVPDGEGSLPRGGGHERLVRVQSNTETSRVRQPGVPEEDGLQRPELPPRSAGQTGSTGRSPTT